MSQLQQITEEIQQISINLRPWVVVEAELLHVLNQIKLNNSGIPLSHTVTSKQRHLDRVSACKDPLLFRVYCQERYVDDLCDRVQELVAELKSMNSQLFMETFNK